ncbi:hypothetical protein E9549_04650 [Blastococcus sp. MG754426]|uniref:Uncharacterized protein n=3 Tax=Geodermatophilaceae TaxID=85030 RepID=A0A285VKJ7_9ACTN|nr:MULTISPECIES: hypothetical protein [Geodermatophilaceae]MCF6506696.1 hypothetical protein [Blastococcus sp. MG754426]MCF6511508.1 hypothetical protein [Blastococcus sp. MG754427]SOC53091.1 hypothetical protein SAMN05660748_4332 [Blastococcus aggregatus]SSC22117.1 Hypothetical protein KLENKIAIHU_698 [Klenkia terrae]
MSAAPRPDRSDDWVALLGGVRVSRQWMTRHTPELLAAWCEAMPEARRRAIAAEIVRVAAEMESEPVGRRDDEPADPAWEAVARRIDPRLLDGPDWWPLSAALTRAAAAGYDVAAGLPGLAAAPLPDRHPARELHWRLLDDCPAALPVPDADGGPATPPPR